MVRSKFKQFSLKNFFNHSIVRWWIVGLFFTGMNIPLLYVFQEWWHLPLWVSTFLASEVGTMLRFLVNDRWVFGHPRPSWKRLWQYHVAISSSFVIWFAIANYLPNQFDIHYLIAAILATCCSVGWSMITNFLWIWRKKQNDLPLEEEKEHQTSSNIQSN